MFTFDECDVVTDESGTMGVDDVTGAAVDAEAVTAVEVSLGAGTDVVDVLATDTTGVTDTCC